MAFTTKKKIMTGVAVLGSVAGASSLDAQTVTAETQAVSQQDKQKRDIVAEAVANTVVPTMDDLTAVFGLTGAHGNVLDTFEEFAEEAVAATEQNPTEKNATFSQLLIDALEDSDFRTSLQERQNQAWSPVAPVAVEAVASVVEAPVVEAPVQTVEVPVVPVAEEVVTEVEDPAAVEVVAPQVENLVVAEAPASVEDTMEAPVTAVEVAPEATTTSVEVSAAPVVEAMETPAVEAEVAPEVEAVSTEAAVATVEAAEVSQEEASKIEVPVVEETQAVEAAPAVDQAAEAVAAQQAEAERQAAEAAAAQQAEAERQAAQEQQQVEAGSITPTYNYNTSGSYPVGQCTWGVKVMAPWVGDYWGNGGDWAASAAAAGYRTGTTPQVGAIASWNDGGYGHVAYVTDVQSENAIQVYEANYAGNQSIGNYRGTFDPTTAQGTVTYIYPN